MFEIFAVSAVSLLFRKNLDNKPSTYRIRVRIGLWLFSNILHVHFVFIEWLVVGFHLDIPANSHAPHVSVRLRDETIVRRRGRQDYTEVVLTPMFNDTGDKASQGGAGETIERVRWHPHDFPSSPIL